MSSKQISTESQATIAPPSATPPTGYWLLATGYSLLVLWYGRYGRYASPYGKRYGASRPCNIPLLSNMEVGNKTLDTRHVRLVYY